MSPSYLINVVSFFLADSGVVGLDFGAEFRVKDLSWMDTLRGALMVRVGIAWAKYQSSGTV